MTQTDYYTQKVLDSVFRGVDYHPAAYVGLGYDDGGGGISEVPDAGYTRKLVSWDPALADGSISNSNEIMWAAGGWGTVTRLFLSDASQGGDITFSVTVNVNAEAGAKIVIGAGDLSVA